MCQILRIDTCLLRTYQNQQHLFFLRPYLIITHESRGYDFKLQVTREVTPITICTYIITEHMSLHVQSNRLSIDATATRNSKGGDSLARVLAAINITCQDL